MPREIIIGTITLKATINICCGYWKSVPPEKGILPRYEEVIPEISQVAFVAACRVIPSPKLTGKRQFIVLECEFTLPPEDKITPTDHTYINDKTHLIAHRYMNLLENDEAFKELKALYFMEDFLID